MYTVFVTVYFELGFGAWSEARLRSSWVCLSCVLPPFAALDLLSLVVVFFGAATAGAAPWGGSSEPRGRERDRFSPPILIEEKDRRGLDRWITRRETGTSRVWYRTWYTIPGEERLFSRSRSVTPSASNTRRSASSPRRVCTRASSCTVARRQLCPSGMCCLSGPCLKEPCCAMLSTVWVIVALSPELPETMPSSSPTILTTELPGITLFHVLPFLALPQSGNCKALGTVFFRSKVIDYGTLQCACEAQFSRRVACMK